jgi:alkylhydroperoxidase family enzyme
MSVLKAVTPDTASEKSKELLTSTEKRLGGSSNMLRIMANSPAMLGAYLQFNHAFDEGKMTPKLRALITAAVAELNGDDYMLSTAMVLGPRLGATIDELNRARQLQASDLSAAAALHFTAVFLRNRGQVSAEEVENLHAAGFDDEKIVEIVALIALNIFRNYLNLVAATEIDLPAVKSNRTLLGRSAGQ